MPIAPRPHHTWQLGQGRTIALGQRTILMGILNLTPDSFSDGGQFPNPQHAIDHALQMLDEGADIVDLGAESTRPGTQLTLTPEEEQQALAPVLEGILKARPEATLSVDTFHAATARFAINTGAHIVNDVSGFLWDGEMAATCASLDCGLVLMHTRGKPSEWASQQPLKPEEVIPTVQSGLAEILQTAQHHNIAKERIVLDPGFGFGKRGAENNTLLANLAQLKALQQPLLIGLSRKGFLAPHAQPKDRLAATIAANTAAILQGAHILRVHDVAAAKQAATYIDTLLP